MRYKLNIRAISLTIIMLLFSLSCDETEPIVAEDPVNVYTLSIASLINHCSKVGCIEDNSGNPLPVSQHSKEKIAANFIVTWDNVNTLMHYPNRDGFDFPSEFEKHIGFRFEYQKEKK